MKKIFALLLAVLLVFCLVPELAFAEENDLGDILIMPVASPSAIERGESGNIVISSDYVYQTFITFYENNQQRGSFSDGEQSAAEYLKEELIALGYESGKAAKDYLQEFSVYVEKNYSVTEGSTGKLLASQNVVGVLNAEGERRGTLIIGAHYDTSYADNDGARTLGAYDNASGVAVALSIAKAFSEYRLPFDVEIVFFGAEEAGLYGSKYYVDNLSEAEKNDIVLMTNLDSVMCGDFLYAYTEEIEEPHSALFYDKAKSLNVELNKVPTDKREYLVSDGRTFSHVGHQMDSYPFNLADIPAITFFGYNWESDVVYSTFESEKHADVMHTDNDNLDYLLSQYGEEFLRTRLAGVSSIVASAVSDAAFSEVMEASKNDRSVNHLLLSDGFAPIVAAAIIVLAFVAVTVKYFSLKKIAPDEKKPEEEKKELFDDGNDVFS